MSPSRNVVRIGGASAMWGDSAIATPQLLTVAGLDYLSYDYLAETTMSILSRARARDPSLGFATDFVTVAMAENLEAIARAGVKVLSNAGGLNPEECRTALAALGVPRRVAVVKGDDVLSQVPSRENLLSANAYLGARAIHRALGLGADVVVTGRVVDSAFAVAALVHEFSRPWDDWDFLAQATLAGHILECGAQATGGLFTDWKDVPRWDDIGYPVVEFSEDGSFVVTKPEGTGGLVTPGTVTEQILYEIGDPAEYVMPDVTVDLREVRVESAGRDRVRVEGARGAPPPDSLKVSATYQDGYRLDALLAIRGIDALPKARKTADALLERSRRLMSARGFSDYRESSVEYLGAESLYGPHARASEPREIVLRLAVTHDERAALEILRREAPSAGTSMGPGTRGHFGGRPEIQPVVRLSSFFIPRTTVRPQIDFEDRIEDVPEPAMVREERRARALSPAEPRPSVPELTEVPLVLLAYARSGDKEDVCNIGVAARAPELWPFLRDGLTAEAVAKYLEHLVAGKVERFELPGLRALNFVLHDALGGGGMSSLRSDPLGKSFAQILLEIPIVAPASLVPGRR